MSFQSAWKTGLEIKKIYMHNMYSKRMKRAKHFYQKNHNSLSDHAFLTTEKAAWEPSLNYSNHHLTKAEIMGLKTLSSSLCFFIH